MKKRAFLITLAALLCLLCALCLAACGGEPAPVCQHRDADDNALCDKCGESYTDGTDVTPPGGNDTPTHTHVFGEWIVTTPATCVAKGIQTRACDCGHSETQYIAIDTTAHSADTEWKTDGTHHWNSCTRTGCDAQLNKGTHGYGSWQETLAPTCVAKGSHYKTCTTCTKKVTEDIPVDPTAHKAGTEWKTNDTHHWKVCTRTGCDARVNEAAHTPAVAWSSDATNHWHDCTACGYDINLIAHTYDAENTCVCQHYKDAGVKFTLNNGTYAVTDYTGTDTEVIIPSKYKGIAVTAIGERAFYECDSLQSITIPAGVTAIGYKAFDDCSNLTAVCITDLAAWCNIDFGNSYANPLCYAKNLYLNGQLVTALEIPSSVTAIKNYAFSDCSSLQTVTFGANSQLTAIGNSAFSYCRGLQSITIPAGVTTIGNSAFYNCRNLQSITIPAGVTSIGYGAFRSCNSLQSITIPAGVTTIGDEAFYACSGLESIIVKSGNTVYHSAGNCLIETASKTLIRGCNNSVIPTDGSVTTIGDYAFCFCSSLQSITIPASVTTIGDEAFIDCNGLQSITIPAGVTSIGYGAFRSCNSLQTVTFGENSQLTTIGDDAFDDCNILKTITIPAGVTTIGDDAFYYCGSLESIIVESGNTVYHSAGNCLIETASKTLIRGCKNSVIPTDGSVTTIGDKAFEYCSGLQSIIIPASVTTIGYDAFYSCDSLQSITIPASVTSIGSYAFYDCSSLQTVTFGENGQLKTIGKCAFNGCSSLQSITILASVTTIGDWAFSDCSNLTAVCITDLAAWCNIDFGNSWANPLYYADNLYLNGQLVTALEIPSSVTAIKNYAFYDCDSLQTVTFGENSQLTAIGDAAFHDCRSLQSITIPASVTTIGDYAFDGCSKLTSVTFGNPNGWWVASSSSATSGTALSATSLAKTGTAATYLTSTYKDKCWKRS